MSGSTSDPNQGGMAGMIDPQTMMLLGAAQGFGQAAMPSRMPVPFGAALGMAAGGVAQGARDAQAMQLQQQQVQAAKLNNARTQGMMNFFSGGQSPGGGGSPFGVPSSGQGGQGQGQGQGGQSTDANGNYLLSPQRLLGLANMMAYSGQDRAAASLYGMLGNQANGYAMGPDGRAFPVPGGGKDPNNTFALAQAEAGGKVGPETTLAANKAAIDLNLKKNTPQDLGNGLFGTPDSLVGQPNGAATPTSVDPFPAIAARINGAENQTGNPGTKNSQSSATGNGQFIDGTWPSVIRATRPDLAAGKSDAQLMSLRADPDIATQATTLYARQNAATMAQAGVPVTPGNIYLAHTMGVNGAIAAIRANPNTPMSLLQSADVIARNPQMQGQTSGGLRAWADQKMQGGAAPSPTPPGITRTQLPGGAVQTTNTRPVQEEQYRNDMKSADAATDDINHAQQQQARLLAMKDLVTKLPTGALGDQRTAIANYIQTFMPSLANTWMTKAANIPDAALAQEFGKFGLVGAGADERGVLGGRGSLGAINLFKQANPGMNLQDGANKSIINMQLVAHQADIDYGRGLQQFVNGSGQNYVAGKENYHPSSEYDQQWTAQHNPQVYAAAMSALNGDPFGKWAKGLSKEDGLRTMQIIGRIDPTSTVLDENKKPMPVSAFMPQAAQ
jgi:hypothetical protein